MASDIPKTLNPFTHYEEALSDLVKLAGALGINMSERD